MAHSPEADLRVLAAALLDQTDAVKDAKRLDRDPAPHLAEIERLRKRIEAIAARIKNED